MSRIVFLKKDIVAFLTALCGVFGLEFKHSYFFLAE